MRFFFLILLLAAGGIWWNQSTSPDIDSASRIPEGIGEPDAVMKGGDFPASTLPSTGSRQRDSVMTPTLTKVLLKSFNTAQSYRALLHDAVQQPKLGGYMYAYAAMGMCKEFSRSSQLEVADPSRREAVSILQARCDISKADREDALRQLAAARGAEITDDPLLRLTFDLLQSKNLAEKQTVLARGLATEDPLLVRALITPQPVRSENGEATFELLGNNYAGKTGKELIDFALDLLDCDLGMDCSRSSTRALRLCANNGWCGESVGESIRLGLSSSDGFTFNQVDALSRQLIDAVRKKDARTLLRK